MFNDISEILNRLLGLNLDSKDLGVTHMSLRALIVFIAAITMIRIGDKRFMGRNTALDVMLGIVFGSVVSRAITGNAPFFPTLAASLVLVLLHWFMSFIAFRSDKFGDVVKGNERLLVRDGEIQWENMKKSHITENDLHEALRNNGHPPDVSRAQSAHLERNGDISIIMRKN